MTSAQQALSQQALAWEDPPRLRPLAASPVLAVAGFTGPLDWLLEMARARKIDLARLSIVALVAAFGDAMDTALARAPDAPAPDLPQWAAWTVMAAQLTELRSRLLLPTDTPHARAVQAAAAAEAAALRLQLIRRQEIAAAADWLQHRPQLGFEVFARGQPEKLHARPAPATTRRPDEPDRKGKPSSKADGPVSALDDDLPVPGGDLTDLLRACLVALRLPAGAAAWQPRLLSFWRVGQAAARIARLLDARPDGAALGAFLPDISGDGPGRARQCRAAVAATFVAGLELACGGTLTLHQDAAWRSIHIQRRDGQSPQGGGEPTATVPLPA